VLCVDEKSQIQALNRTPTGLPLKRGAAARGRAYKRHGITTLLAALVRLKGKVMGQGDKRHQRHEFLRFLRHVGHGFAGDIALHLVVDNYGSHTKPRSKSG